MNTHEILTKTRILLTDPAHWTKLALARREDRHLTSPGHGDAVCWCLTGAVLHTLPYRTNPAVVVAEDLLDSVAMDLFPMRSMKYLDEARIQFNDHDDTKHEDVLKVLDAAIERSKP